jgi:UPF0271 protein
VAVQAFVLDATALIARWPLYAPRGELYTTSLVACEVKDEYSREGLELALQLGRLTIRDPSPKTVRRVEREAAKRGLHISLSRADISIIALALELKSEGKNVIVVSDDYAVENLAGLLGLSFQPVRTRGITRLEEYEAVCPACGYRSRDPNERVCPICGTRLVRVRKGRTVTKF